MELLKLLSASEIVAQIITFLLLLLVLQKMLWKPLLQALDARKAKIASDLKGLEDQRQQMEKMRQDYQARVASMEDDARKRIQEAIAEGKVAADALTGDAYRQAQKIIEQARADIKYELGAAKQELKEKIVDLTMRATESLIQEKLTEEADKRLVEEFLSKVDNLE